MKVILSNWKTPLSEYVQDNEIGSHFGSQKIKNIKRQNRTAKNNRLRSPMPEGGEL